MEQVQRNRPPVISVVALVLGVFCILILAGTAALLLPEWKWESFPIVLFGIWGLTFGQSPTCGTAAIVTGVIGLKRSRRLSQPSKKGVGFSIAGIAAGVVAVLFVLVVFILFLFSHPVGSHPL